MGSKGLNKPLLLFSMLKTTSTFLLLFLALATSHLSFAEDYYWTVSTTALAGSRYDSAIAACRAAYEFRKSSNEVNGSKYAEPVEARITSNGRSASCTWAFPPNYPNGGWVGASATRGGTTCTAPKVYNSATGGCEAPPNECSSKIGQSHSFGGDLGQMETCVDKCMVVVDSSSSDPITTYKKPGDISKTYWWVTGVFSGEECSASDDGDSTPPAPTESKSDRDCTPTTTSEDGTQTSTCTETKTDVDNRDCVAKGGAVGSVNGVMQCVASNKGPKATETKKETKTESKTNPDGSKTEKTTTKTDQKTCSGAGSCSSNTTTNVNNSNTNSDGTKGSESSTCSGSNCTGSTGSGTGDGKGDGKGDGEGEGEGEEGEGPAGPQGTLQKGEQGSFAEGISEWDQRISDVRGELDQKLDQYSGMFKGVFDLDLSTGGGSLPCDNIPVSFGSTSTTLRFCLADYADPLSYLRYALLLGAAALAAIIILRG